MLAKRRSGQLFTLPWRARGTVAFLADRNVGILFCPAWPRRAVRRAPCRLDPPVVCPGFGLDRWKIYYSTLIGRQHIWLLSKPTYWQRFKVRPAAQPWRHAEGYNQTAACLLYLLTQQVEQLVQGGGREVRHTIWRNCRLEVESGACHIVVEKRHAVGSVAEYHLSDDFRVAILRRNLLHQAEVFRYWRRIIHHNLLIELVYEGRADGRVCHQQVAHVANFGAHVCVMPRGLQHRA